ncbi:MULTISPECIES: alpha/beta fold hydrolase [unclassified Acinetobacter]|uniref:alpha/beta fold hydrolase n=1 Tax=unclassified Acinetobacter TaxID=196816 RepID=UPI0035B8A278
MTKSATAKSTTLPFMQQHFIDLSNKQRLCVEMAGDEKRPTILLIMGLGSQLTMWPDAFCQLLLDSGFRVIRFDNRDSGLSNKCEFLQPPLSLLKTMGRFSLGLATNGASYTLYDMAEDVHLLLNTLHIEKAHILGASMGGMIAQILAAKYPNQVKSLGLLFTSNNQSFAQPPNLSILKQMFKRPKSNNPEDIINNTVQFYQMIASPNYSTNSQFYDFAQGLYQRSYHPMGTQRQFYAILTTGSLKKINHMIQSPTLVIHGSKDKLIPPSNGKAVAKAIPHAKFELIDGLGHDISPHFMAKLADLFTDHFMANN